MPPLSARCRDRAAHSASAAADQCACPSADARYGAKGSAAAGTEEAAGYSAGAGLAATAGKAQDGEKGCRGTTQSIGHVVILQWNR